ncbi:MAG: hypothetical protein P8Y97_20345 [Candidatus Lokiarchaeota archaeon]
MIINPTYTVFVSSDSRNSEEDPKMDLKFQLEKEINKQIAIKLKRNEFDKHDYLQMIKEICEIINNCSFLSDQEKLDYCKSERYFMKLYLKRILSD